MFVRAYMGLIRDMKRSKAAETVANEGHGVG